MSASRKLRTLEVYLARGAGDSIKPGVKRSGTPGPNEHGSKPAERATVLVDWPCYIRESIGISNVPIKALSPTPRAGIFFRTVNLGFRYAPPQALCCHPLRGLELMKDSR